MNKPRLRDHLQSSYLAAALACLIGLVFAAQSSAQRTETVLSGNGWKLWLDKAAAWENDKLFLPPVDLAALPKNAPTGGWESLNAKNGMPVSVPGTVEEYTWDEVGDYKGVSWWWRDVSIPESAKGKRVILQFESVRLRAEVFLNSELVCYDLIGNTPFEADITDKVKAGEQNRLAVRVTDPGGNFAWFDADVHDWGEYKIPASHGFGGITGRVKMIVVDPVYVSDIFVANKPTIKDIDVTLTINNTTGARTTDEVKIRISEASGGKKALQEETISGMELPPGLSTVTRSISVPSARAWDLENPNLYTCEVRVTSGNGKFQDVKSERFGFRWFAVDGVGKDAVFRMNGKRVVLRSAISWGFWPTNGIYATEELARKQVESAKALGQNMVNFHRCIGPPICFEKADEMGMFYFEEPGGYASHKGDDFSFAWAREKLLRMVKRDRNHPSLIIYNMINEEGIPPSEKQKKDMADAHKIDPSRVILYTSGWAKDGDDPIKLHMLPYDDTQYIRGWYDVHHALGPGSYRDEFYQGPSSYMLKTDDRAEIVFWGEEGAISSPPRLEKIDEHLEKTGRNGWDGAAYKEWYKAYVKYLDEKGLRKYFPSVDDLTRSMGNIPFYYQGRIIENIRTGDVTDGYVVNGWESELLENHSGIVDCFRNPKGDESIMAHYNSPLYVAVKAHTKIVQIPSTVTVDFFIVNEKDLKGACTLRATLKSPDGKSLWQKEYPVKVSGGDVFGELLVENVALEIKDSTGHFSVEASLVDEKGKVQATGEDKVFAVDWKSAKVPANGAILDPGNNIATFLKKEKGVELPAYSKELGKLDYIVAGDIDPERWAIIPKEAFQTKDGGEAGLMGTYFEGTDLKKKQGERTDEKIDYEWSGNEPFKGVGKEQFSVRWTGRLKPPETGELYVSHHVRRRSAAVARRQASHR